MAQIATWSVNGVDHAGARETSGEFKQSAEEMARAYERAAGLPDGSVVFTVRDAGAPDPRRTPAAQRKADPPAPDRRSSDEKAVDEILAKAESETTPDEAIQMVRWLAKSVRGGRA
jgi:hypothetical protein